MIIEALLSLMQPEEIWVIAGALFVGLWFVLQVSIPSHTGLPSPEGEAVLIESGWCWMLGVAGLIPRIAFLRFRLYRLAQKLEEMEDALFHAQEMRGLAERCLGEESRKVRRFEAKLWQRPAGSLDYRHDHLTFANRFSAQAWMGRVDRRGRRTLILWFNRHGQDPVRP